MILHSKITKRPQITPDVIICYHILPVSTRVVKKQAMYTTTSHIVCTVLPQTAKNSDHIQKGIYALQITRRPIKPPRILHGIR